MKPASSRIRDMAPDRRGAQGVVHCSGSRHVGVHPWAGRAAAVGAVRGAIVRESFLPQVNGLTNSVLRVVEHLHRRGHDTLVVAPGTVGPERYRHAEVTRVRAVDLPVISSLPIGVPSPKVHAALAEFAPDVVHLASPFVLGAAGLRSARRLGVPTVAVYQTDVPGFAAAYGLRHGARAAWHWIRRLHSPGDRTLEPSPAPRGALTEQT